MHVLSSQNSNVLITNSDSIQSRLHSNSI